ncbi:MAG: hypothetical protein OEZ34_11395, partial [Spirochaetia bacterium]|nr:hypothetical protein [Spirochaetia bacterium]
VKLANFSGATVQFPGRKGDLSFTAPPEIEIYQGETSVKKQEIYFSRKTIEAEKEAYYKFKVPLSEHQLQNKKKYIYRIRIPVQSGEILIRFPVTE